MRSLLVIAALIAILYCTGNASPSTTSKDMDIAIVTNRTPVEQKLWDGWKQRYSKALPQGTIIVDPYSGKAFSEAMGHALILGVQFNDQPFFDMVLNGLEHYFRNPNGLFAWEICPGGQRFADAGKNITASETEINVLFALLQARTLRRNNIWKETGADYSRKAHELEQAIWRDETIAYKGKRLLLPSDGKKDPYWPVIRDGKSVQKVAWAPTYFMPAYLKAFDRAFPQHPWNSMVRDGYELLTEVMGRSEELLENDLGVKGKNPVPAWVWLTPTPQNYFKGNTHPGAGYSNEYDSIRVPLYLGTDLLWNNDARAKELLTALLERSGVRTVNDAFAGACPDKKEGYRDHLAISMYGTAHLAEGTHKGFLDDISKAIDQEGYIGWPWEQQYYYNQTLSLYGYLLMQGRFARIIPLSL